MAIAITNQRQLAIGQWTVEQNHPLGDIYKQPAVRGVSGPRTFMYVKFTKGSGADAFQGSPCGFIVASMTDSNFVVCCDQSVSMNGTPCGIIWNTSATAVTTNYYGWIQLAVPGEVLKSVIVSSVGAVAAGSIFVWEADSCLDAATAYTSVVEVVDTPFCAALTGGTQSNNAYVSTTGTWDCLVLLNPYVN